ncbi:MAG: DUF2235 domain-containing protein [Xanthobacteraceae bacterium]|nr:DUF2235 domain-containing protein [Xanthobacteraceae bacterium]
MPGRKIVVFADGTGNAFTTQESNVWRLYQALDQSRPDQLAHYIKGVGTSEFKPFAMLDGATGIGVPSNVRKLYRFICRNWQPGDEIYMFGFSRGSFTIRTLVGLIDHEGLIPAVIDNSPVSQAEMRRNARAAWRAYRAKTIPWTTSLPTIWLTRIVRDLLLGIFNVILRRRAYATVARATKAQHRDEVRIKFVGVFDTVEAYGVPLEEFRRAIDVTIWPISFRNRILTPKVERACHALSLDDERVTFHPLRFDRENSKDPDRIEEVWFAGVHSDVGGGYPIDDLACVPLFWMARRVETDLRFIGGSLQACAERASPYAPAHDSRSGLAVLYRYGPRTVGDNRGAPVIHYSVAQKIAFGTESYAPLTLPSTAEVLMPDGSRQEIRGFDQSKLTVDRIEDPWLRHEMDEAVRAVRALHDPDGDIVATTLDRIWWRRVAYYALLFAVFLVASLPATAVPISRGFRDTVGAVAGWIGLGASWKSAWAWLAGTDKGGSAFVGVIVEYVGTLLPSYAKPWADALILRPTTCFLVFLLALALYIWNGSLRDQIGDLARQAWLPPLREARRREALKRAGKAANAELTPRRSFAGVIRKSKFVGFVECAFVSYLLPAVGVVLIFAAAGLAVSRSTVIFRDGSGRICHESAQTDKLAPGQSIARDDFTADQLCWASRIVLEKGRHYTLWIEMTEPFFDQTIMTDIAGFKDTSWRHASGWFIRRLWIADWFQPVARIGSTGDDVWPLVSVDGDAAIPAGHDVDGNPIPRNFHDAPAYAARLAELRATDPDNDPSRLAVGRKIPPSEVAAANAIRESFKPRKRLVSTFTAGDDGELFLYLNDAIAAIPFGRTITAFYDNNSGRAKITVQQVASPPDPQPGGGR